MRNVICKKNDEQNKEEDYQQENVVRIEVYIDFVEVLAMMIRQWSDKAVLLIKMIALEYLRFVDEKFMIIPLYNERLPCLIKKNQE